MMFPVLNLGDTGVFEAYPLLEDYEDFVAVKESGMDYEPVMKFIFLAYDKNLQSLYPPETIKRRAKAAALANIDLDSPEMGENQVVINRAIVQFLHLQNHRQFKHQMVMEEALNNMYADMLHRPDDEMGSDKKMKLYETLQKIITGTGDLMQQIERGETSIRASMDEKDPVVRDALTILEPGSAMAKARKYGG